MYHYFYFRKNVIINKNTRGTDSVEIIRVVPVVIYTKNKTNLVKTYVFNSLMISQLNNLICRFVNDFEIEVTQKSDPFSSLDEVLKQKIKKECTSLEKKWSKRLKSTPDVLHVGKSRSKN